MQRHVIASMLRDSMTFARCRSFIVPDHFTDEATSDVVALAFNLWDRFKEVPSRTALLDVFQEQEAHRKVIKRAFDESEEVRDAEITIDRIAKFARQRALRLAVREAASILKYEQTGDDSELPRDAKGRPVVRDIGAIFETARMVGSNVGDIGVFLDAATQAAIERAKNPQQRDLFSTGFSHLDECGVNLERGEVGCVLARAKGGKSQVLLNIALANARAERKVIYYNLEIREDRLEDRFANRIARTTPVERKKKTEKNLPPQKAGATAAEVAQRAKLDEKLDDEIRAEHREAQEHLETWAAAIEKRVGPVGKRLLLKKFIAKQASVDDLRAHLIACRAQGFVPDMIIVDYVGILKSTEKFTEVRHLLAGLWLDFRSLCQEFNVAGWSAAQANRGGAAADLVTMTAIAESFEIVQHIDVGFSVNRADDEIQQDKGRFFVFASRNDRDNTVVDFNCNFACSYVTTTRISTLAREGTGKGRKKTTEDERSEVAHRAAEARYNRKTAPEAPDGRA